MEYAMVLRLLLSIPLVLMFTAQSIASPLIINVDNRSAISLNGKWQIIVDPYETGFYDYHLKQTVKHGYFENAKPKTKSDRIEYSFTDANLLDVPGDWNTQRKDLYYYEGTLWYKKDFMASKEPGTRLFLYFGAANYHAIVYLNGQKIGEHIGGFTPFNFEITEKVRSGNNFVVAKINNTRLRVGVPTVNTDWWNYGGITRRVLLIEVPETFIQDYFIQLRKGSSNTIEGWVQLDGKKRIQKGTISIPELKIETSFRTNDQGRCRFQFEAAPELWSPEHPKCYDVILQTETDRIQDRIGFRTIETRGQDILLNGKPVFLRGICIHEEAPIRGGRAFSREDGQILLNWAKELNCNFVRLAHYPHNEDMIRLADEMGLLVWSEIPVYWTILFDNEPTFENAKNQLTEMITRDKNRASVILWSIANETPVGQERTEFLRKLAAQARMLDSTRLITAAMDQQYLNDTTMMVKDPLGEYLDVLGINEYIGWYDGLPEKCGRMVWKTVYDKPHIISEFGGGALFGDHGDELTRWTEEYQENLYRQQTDMLKRIPFLSGTCPWILMDFRSPRRPLPGIQDGWNRKGLISNRGEKKKAFFIMQQFYREWMEPQN